METALAYYDDSLNADIFYFNEAMNAIDAVEWRESMQYKLDALEARDVLGQYCHDTRWVFKRKCADDQPLKW